jgi:hypothetical protein
LTRAIKLPSLAIRPFSPPTEQRHIAVVNSEDGQEVGKNNTSKEDHHGSEQSGWRQKAKG